MIKIRIEQVEVEVEGSDDFVRSTLRELSDRLAMVLERPDRDPRESGYSPPTVKRYPSDGKPPTE